MQPDEALAFLKQGAAQIISENELREKLALGRPLRIKLGVDPTTSDIHLGHSIVLRKLRQFQDLGHQAVLIIGDFTGMIGDPSGRSATRPQLTHKEVMANAASYREQAFKILDPARTERVCNGDWFRTMSFEDVIRLNSRVSLQQMLQREDFRARIDKQQAIRAHEIQYPIMQGWDSVMVKADVELGRADLPPFSANTLQTAELVTVVCSAYREAFNAQKSRSEASRLIKQGSVELDGTKIHDPKATVTLKAGQILRLDKKHAVRIE